MNIKKIFNQRFILIPWKCGIMDKEIQRENEYQATFSIESPSTGLVGLTNSKLVIETVMH